MEERDLSKAEQMRRLYLAGHPISEIARLLHVRYQHVRNTVKGSGSEKALETTRRLMQEEGASSPTGVEGAQSSGAAGSDSPHDPNDVVKLLKEIRDEVRQIKERLA